MAIINFCSVDLREVGQARSWESALRQISKMPCKVIAVHLGKRNFIIAWNILNRIYKQLQKGESIPVAVNGEVWYIEHFDDVEKLFYMLPTHRLFINQFGVLSYVGAIRSNNQKSTVH